MSSAGCSESPQLKAVYELFAPLDTLFVGLHTVFEHHEAIAKTASRAFLHDYRIRCPVGVDRPAAVSSVQTGQLPT